MMPSLPRKTLLIAILFASVPTFAAAQSDPQIPVGPSVTPTPSASTPATSADSSAIAPTPAAGSGLPDPVPQRSTIAPADAPTSSVPEVPNDVPKPDVAQPAD